MYYWKMRRPIIKDSFSVDDIHKIREYHYEMTKNLSREEKIKEIKDKADKVKEELRRKKEERAAV